MRLTSLDLEAYGPFAGCRLAFRPDAGLHIVYGPNEAGKTSALSAIGDLLFGFGHRTDHAFRHVNSALRIGGALRAGDGRIIRFRRRKASRNTIVDADDKPLDEELLAPLLGTVKRDDFDAEFGLTAAALRRGGDELLRAGGRLAETLAASSAGVLALSRLKTRLDAQAEALFTPRKTASKPFYMTLAAYEDAEKRLKASIVTNEKLAAAERELNEARNARNEIAQAYEDLGRQIARLNRARQTFPKLARLADARQALAACGDLPDIAADLLERWRLQAQERRAMATQAAGLEEAEAADCKAIAALTLDEDVLNNAERIAALHDRAVEVRKGLSDLPRRREAYAAARSKLEIFARQLGLPDVEALLEREPPAPDLARAEDIIEQRRMAESHVKEAQQRLAGLREDIERLHAPVEAGSYPVDPAEWRRQFEALRRIPADAQALRELDAARNREGQALAEDAARMRPATTPDALAQMPLPSAEDIAAAVREAAEIAQEARRLNEDAAAAARATKQAEEAMRGFAQAAVRATPERLRAERERRDRAMDLFAQFIDGPAEIRNTHFVDMREATRAADAIADLLLDSARTIAQAQAAARALAEKQEKEKDIATAQQACQSRREAFAADWRSLWRPCGVEAGEPAQMQRWRDAAGAVLKRREGLAALAEKAAVLHARLEDGRTALATLAQDIGAATPTGAAADLLYDLVREKLDGLQKIWNEGRERAGALQRTEQDFRKTGKECESAEAELAAFIARWPHEIACLGLDGQAGVQQAAAALKIWQATPGESGAIHLLQRSIEGIEGDEEIYREAVTAIVGECAPELAALKPDDAVSALQKRLETAARARTERERLLGEIEKRQRQKEAHAARAAGLDAGLETAFKALGASDTEEVLAALRQHDDQRAKAQEVETILRDLRETAPGHDEADLRAEQDGLDYDALAAQIAGLEASLGVQRSELDRAVERISTAKMALATLSQTSQAAHFAQAAAAAKGERREIASQWLVRAAAAGLARAAIERHREKMQDPLVEQASQLFRAATAGAFSGLAADFGDDGQPTLSARRAGGEKAPVPGLSEGTRDQLFLALRLALLQSRAGEPLPFIGDDLLASFDDERAGHTLEMLADFGARRQAVLFTHHRHIAELAARRLGDRLDLIELGV